MQWMLVAGVAGLAGASALAGYRMDSAGWGGDGNPLLVHLPWSEKKEALLDALHVDPRSAATVEVQPLGVLSRKYDAELLRVER